MDTVTTATSSPATAPISAAQAENTDAESNSTAISSDFETFLRMLTVQMENQDPLNPIESTDFSVQLATFSGVEQQVRTNDLLESLLSDQTTGGLADIAGWVGQEARAPVAAQYEGAPVTLYSDLPQNADQATLRVRDSFGNLVSQVALPTDGANSFVWDGTDASGTPGPQGLYSFSVETFSRGEPLGTQTPEVYAPVTEARLENGVPVLVFAGGEAIAPANITGLRAP